MAVSFYLLSLSIGYSLAICPCERPAGGFMTTVTSLESDFRVRSGWCCNQVSSDATSATHNCYCGCSRGRGAFDGIFTFKSVAVDSTSWVLSYELNAVQSLLPGDQLILRKPSSHSCQGDVITSYPTLDALLSESGTLSPLSAPAAIDSSYAELCLEPCTPDGASARLLRSSIVICPPGWQQPDVNVPLCVTKLPDAPWTACRDSCRNAAPSRGSTIFSPPDAAAMWAPQIVAAVSGGHVGLELLRTAAGPMLDLAAGGLVVPPAHPRPFATSGTVLPMIANGGLSTADALLASSGTLAHLEIIADVPRLVLTDGTASRKCVCTVTGGSMESIASAVCPPGWTHVPNPSGTRPIYCAQVLPRDVPCGEDGTATWAAELYAPWAGHAPTAWAASTLSALVNRAAYTHEAYDGVFLTGLQAVKGNPPGISFGAAHRICAGECLRLPWADGRPAITSTHDAQCVAVRRDGLLVMSPCTAPLQLCGIRLDTACDGADDVVGGGYCGRVVTTSAVSEAACVATCSAAAPAAGGSHVFTEVFSPHTSDTGGWAAFAAAAAGPTWVGAVVAPDGAVAFAGAEMTCPIGCPSLARALNVPPAGLRGGPGQVAFDRSSGSLGLAASATCACGIARRPPSCPLGTTAAPSTDRDAYCHVTLPPATVVASAHACATACAARALGPFAPHDDAHVTSAAILAPGTDTYMTGLVDVHADGTVADLEGWRAACKAPCSLLHAPSRRPAADFVGAPAAALARPDAAAAAVRYYPATTATHRCVCGVHLTQTRECAGGDVGFPPEAPVYCASAAGAASLPPSAPAGACYGTAAAARAPPLYSPWLGWASLPNGPLSSFAFSALATFAGGGRVSVYGVRSTLDDPAEYLSDLNPPLRVAHSAYRWAAAPPPSPAGPICAVADGASGLPRAVPCGTAGLWGCVRGYPLTTQRLCGAPSVAFPDLSPTVAPSTCVFTSTDTAAPAACAAACAAAPLRGGYPFAPPPHLLPSLPPSWATSAPGAWSGIHDTIIEGSAASRGQSWGRVPTVQWDALSTDPADANAGDRDNVLIHAGVLRFTASTAALPCICEIATAPTVATTRLGAAAAGAPDGVALALRDNVDYTGGYPSRLTGSHHGVVYPIPGARGAGECAAACSADAAGLPWYEPPLDVADLYRPGYVAGVAALRDWTAGAAWVRLRLLSLASAESGALPAARVSVAWADHPAAVPSSQGRSPGCAAYSPAVANIAARACSAAAGSQCVCGHYSGPRLCPDGWPLVGGVCVGVAPSAAHGACGCAGAANGVARAFAPWLRRLLAGEPDWDADALSAALTARGVTGRLWTGLAVGAHPFLVSANNPICGRDCFAKLFPHTGEPPPTAPPDDMCVFLDVNVRRFDLGSCSAVFQCMCMIETAPRACPPTFTPVPADVPLSCVAAVGSVPSQGACSAVCAGAGSSPFAPPPPQRNRIVGLDVYSAAAGVVAVAAWTGWRRVHGGAFAAAESEYSVYSAAAQLGAVGPTATSGQGCLSLGPDGLLVETGCNAAPRPCLCETALSHTWCPPPYVPHPLHAPVMCLYNKASTPTTRDVCAADCAASSQAPGASIYDVDPLLLTVPAFTPRAAGGAHHHALAFEPAHHHVTAPTARREWHGRQAVDLYGPAGLPAATLTATHVTFPVAIGTAPLAAALPTAAALCSCTIQFLTSGCRRGMRGIGAPPAAPWVSAYYPVACISSQPGATTSVNGAAAATACGSSTIPQTPLYIWPGHGAGARLGAHGAQHMAAYDARDLSEAASTLPAHVTAATVLWTGIGHTSHSDTYTFADPTLPDATATELLGPSQPQAPVRIDTQYCIGVERGSPNTYKSYICSSTQGIAMCVVEHARRACPASMRPVGFHGCAAVSTAPTTTPHTCDAVCGAQFGVVGKYDPWHGLNDVYSSIPSQNPFVQSAMQDSLGIGVGSVWYGPHATASTSSGLNIDYLASNHRVFVFGQANPAYVDRTLPHNGGADAFLPFPHGGTSTGDCFVFDSGDATTPHAMARTTDCATARPCVCGLARHAPFCAPGSTPVGGTATTAPTHCVRIRPPVSGTCAAACRSGAGGIMRNYAPPTSSPDHTNPAASQAICSIAGAGARIGTGYYHRRASSGAQLVYSAQSATATSAYGLSASGDTRVNIVCASNALASESAAPASCACAVPTRRHSCPAGMGVFNVGDTSQPSSTVRLCVRQQPGECSSSRLDLFGPPGKMRVVRGAGETNVDTNAYSLANQAILKAMHNGANIADPPSPLTGALPSRASYTICSSASCAVSPALICLFGTQAMLWDPNPLLGVVGCFGYSDPYLCTTDAPM